MVGMKHKMTDSGRSVSTRGVGEQRDCTVRALATVAGVEYDKAHLVMTGLGRKKNCGVYFKQRAQKAFKSLGLNARCVRRSGSLERLVRDFPTGRLYVLVRGHAFAVVDGVVHDNWTQSGRRHIKQAWLISK